jgi:hypothetical protein
MAAPSMRQTDQELLDAYQDLVTRRLRATDARIAELVGRTARAVKKRRQSLIRRGVWAGPAVRNRSWGSVPSDVERYIKQRFEAPAEPSKARIALDVKALFGRAITPRAVGAILARPSEARIKTLHQVVQAEAMREFRTRHDAEPYCGTPAWRLIRSMSALGSDGASELGWGSKRGASC